MNLLPIIITLLLPQGIFSLVCWCTNHVDCLDDKCTTDGRCFKSLTRNNGIVREQFQCISSDQLIPPFRPFICEYSKKTTHKYKSDCCADEDLCNLNLTITLDPVLVPNKPIDSEFNSMYIIITIFGVLVFIFTTGCLLYLVRSGRCRKDQLPCMKLYTEVETQSCETGATNLASLQDVLNMSSTGSGSGLPLLLQRTIARQIQLKECSGTGRFGAVHRGEWRGENVAVKIFSSVEEQSWFREVEIYQTSMLRHDNILAFIAADNKDNGTWTQLWLITKYMELGSLFDYLSKITVSERVAVEMCLQMATGLAHLHLEIIGTQGKPAIAHRDLKSKNILVRQDGVCAVADLGLAVRYFSDGNYIDVPSNTRVGTKRYLAPEVLDNSIHREDFELYKQGDIYALGLVFWEVINRIEMGDRTNPYQPPYWDTVGIDPSVDEMRKVVCIDNVRPDLPVELMKGSGEVFTIMSKLMTECWYPQPSSRLSALRIKKTLSTLKQSLFNAELA